MISLKQKINESSERLFKYRYDIYPNEWNALITLTKGNNKKAKVEDGDLYKNLLVGKSSVAKFDDDSYIIYTDIPKDIFNLSILHNDEIALKKIGKFLK